MRPLEGRKSRSVWHKRDTAEEVSWSVPFRNPSIPQFLQSRATPFISVYDVSEPIRRPLVTFAVDVSPIFLYNN